MTHTTSSPSLLEGTSTDMLPVAARELPTALSAAHLGVWQVDLALGILNLSAQVAPMLGLVPDNLSLQREEWLGFVHPGDRARVEESWSAATRGEPLPRLDFRVLWRDGQTVRWLASHGALLQDDGKPSRIVGVCRDITDDKRTQEDLSRSVRRFASLVEATTDIIWTIDPTGAITSAQEPWAEFTGQSRTEYQGWGWLNAVHPDDREHSAQALRECLTSKTLCTLEHCLRRKDGAWRDMTMRAVPVLDEDGSVREWVGVHTDITAQKAAARQQERARQEAEAALTQFEAVLRSAHDGIIVSDPIGNVLMWNPAGLAMHDFKTLEEAQKHASEFANLFTYLLEGDGVLPFEKWPLPRLMRGDAFTDYEVHVSRHDTGTQWWASYSGSEVHDKEGKTILLLLTVRDVSERRRMEAQRDTLLRRIDEATQRQRRFLREMLSSMTEGRLRLCDREADLPSRLTPEPFAPPVDLSRGTIRTLRRLVDSGCSAANLPMERQNDLVTAVGEAAMNAVVHAKTGTGIVYADVARGVVQVWVSDKGHGINEENLHRATLEKGFSSAGTLGHGFWMMLKTADRVYLLTGSHGTTVVMEQDKEPPLPAWLQTNDY